MHVERYNFEKKQARNKNGKSKRNISYSPVCAKMARKGRLLNNVFKN